MKVFDVFFIFGFLGLFLYMLAVVIRRYYQLIYVLSTRIYSMHAWKNEIRHEWLKMFWCIRRCIHIVAKSHFAWYTSVSCMHYSDYTSVRYITEYSRQCHDNRFTSSLLSIIKFRNNQNRNKFGFSFFCAFCSRKSNKNLHRRGILNMQQLMQKNSFN